MFDVVGCLHVRLVFLSVWLSAICQVYTKADVLLDSDAATDLEDDLYEHTLYQSPSIQKQVTQQYMLGLCLQSKVMSFLFFYFCQNRQGATLRLEWSM